MFVEKFCSRLTNEYVVCAYRTDKDACITTEFFTLYKRSQTAKSFNLLWHSLYINWSYQFSSYSIAMTGGSDVYLVMLYVSN